MNSSRALISTVLMLWATAFSAGAPAQKSPSEPARLAMEGRLDEALRQAATVDGGVAAVLGELMSIADDQITTRRITEAKATLEAASSLVDRHAKSGRGKPVARAALDGRQLRLEGIQLSDEKQFEKAETSLRKALDVSAKTEDGVLIAGIHNNLGYSLRHQERFEEAAQEFELARKLAEKQKDDLRAGSYNFNLGEVLHQLGRVQAAAEAFKRSAGQNRAASRTSLEARAILMQGLCTSKANAHSPEPMQLFAQAQGMFERLGDNRNVGWSYRLMGEHLAYTMQFPEAAAYTEKALPWLTKAGDKAGLLASYQFLADMYSKTGDVARSDRFKKMAQELLHKQ